MRDDVRLVAERFLRGQSQQVCIIREALIRIGPLDSTVLLTGETGTGKGHVARALHAASTRATKPFVHVDCAALSPSLIESELFGHEKGSFTNAAARRIGRFERAQRGTIFLDEIGDLDLRLQSKLLRVLDDRAYERLGGTETLHMDARIIAATSHDLVQAVIDGRFRADLFFRLRVFHLLMPPLRDRLDDLPELVAEGLARVCKRLRIGQPTVGEDFLDRLRCHTWPGNVRELLNVLEQAVVSCRQGQLAEESLYSAFQDSLRFGGAQRPSSERTDCPWNLHVYREQMEEGERSEIVRALEASRGNVAAAARRLKIPRSTLRHRIDKHDLARLIAHGN